MPRLPVAQEVACRSCMRNRYVSACESASGELRVVYAELSVQMQMLVGLLMQHCEYAEFGN